MTSKALQHRLDKILALHPKVIDLSLDRILVLLEKLGNPHDRLPPTIHVAGTNGKGSTIAFLQAIFEAAGYSVHRYISPHLVRFNERITLAGNEVSDEKLIETLDHVLAVNGTDPITFFELTTAAAFCLFSEHPADVLLLETGLGGRLDATNVIKNPIACVITPISMDHQEFLGDTIEDIAKEKAGIIKAGVPVMSATQAPAVTTILQNHADMNKTTLQLGSRDWAAVENPINNYYFTFFNNNEGDQLAKTYDKPAIEGAHQIENAGLALTTAWQLDGIFSRLALFEHLEDGIVGASWPARLQKLEHFVCNGKQQEVYIDGSHNEAGLKSLADWLGEQHQPIHLIIGMKGNKNHQAAFDHLSPHAVSVQLVSVQGEPVPEGLQHAFAQFNNPANISILADTVESAVNTITQNFPIDNTGTILITGSLYLAGEVLAMNEA